MTFEEWLAYGQKHEFISPVYCLTHDLIPMSETEDMLWEEGMDLCASGVRLGNIEEWEEQAPTLARY
jgi:hypothetical protein